jgi:hypothetical protein
LVESYSREAAKPLAACTPGVGGMTLESVGHVAIYFWIVAAQLRTTVNGATLGC